MTGYELPTFGGWGKHATTGPYHLAIYSSLTVFMGRLSMTRSRWFPWRRSWRRKAIQVAFGTFIERNHLSHILNSPADKVANVEKIANKAVLVLFEHQHCLHHHKKSPLRGLLGKIFSEPFSEGWYESRFWPFFHQFVVEKEDEAR